MNQISENFESNSNNKCQSQIESSDEESSNTNYFHINQTLSKSNNKNINNQLLSKKRYQECISEEENEDNKSKNSKDESDENSKNQKKNKNNKGKEKYSNFKSVKSRQICQFYINGACKKGDKCPYSHNAEQIHKKELCKFYLSGKCAKGSKCLYSHDLSEIPCKFYHGQGFCENSPNCPFSHERLDQEGIKEFIISNEDFLKETKNKYGRTNMDEFYNKYLKEKEGDEQYIMMPEFIKNEDKEKEKEINDVKNKIPLGLVVMSNSAKVINELNNLYSMQNMNIINNSNNNINIESFNNANRNYVIRNDIGISNFNNNNLYNKDKGNIINNNKEISINDNIKNNNNNIDSSKSFNKNQDIKIVSNKNNDYIIDNNKEEKNIENKTVFNNVNNISNKITAFDR